MSIREGFMRSKVERERLRRQDDDSVNIPDEEFLI